MLVYIDDIKSVTNTTKDMMKDISKEFDITNGEYGPPMIYLEAGISKVHLITGKECWSVVSKKYVKTARQEVQELLSEDGRELKWTRQTQLPNANILSIRVETTPMCDKDHST